MLGRVIDNRLAVQPCPIELHRSADEPVSGTRVRESRQFVRIRPGVYAPRAEWDALMPWQRYLARVHAYALARPDAVFSHESAAALLGLPVFGEPRDIHVLERRSKSSHRSGEVCHHAAMEPRGIRAGEILTTAVRDTVVDLMRVLPPAFALAVGDAAARSDPATTVADLRGLAASQSARRGNGRLTWLWARIDPDSESVGESVSRAVIEWSGFPPPELQVRFSGEGFEDRADFFWRRYRVIGESDGYGKYLLSDPADPLAALKTEKTREDRLRRQVDAVARWDYGDTMRAVPLQRKIAHAGVPQLYPAQQGLLRTLAHNPRSLGR